MFVTWEGALGGFRDMQEDSYDSVLFSQNADSADDLCKSIPQYVHSSHGMKTGEK